MDLEESDPKPFLTWRNLVRAGLRGVFLAVPLLGLYLLGVGVAWIFDPSRRKREDAGGSAD